MLIHMLIQMSAGEGSAAGELRCAPGEVRACARGSLGASRLHPCKSLDISRADRGSRLAL